jgi:tRNA threonylcarbamoyladenosine biosynthesis protein TsaB
VTKILALDTSTAWCSVALSIDDQPNLYRHDKVGSASSQVLLPWIDELLSESHCSLDLLDAIAVGVGPGAFTGVRMAIAVTQGLATAAKLPVIAVASLDAVAAQLVLTKKFAASGAKNFVIALDARMNEVYWASYQYSGTGLPMRMTDIALSSPELVDLAGAQFVAGSAIAEFGEKLLSSMANHTDSDLDSDISIHAEGILLCAHQQWAHGLQQDVHLLEPLYIRNKVALTTAEREKLGHV